MSLSRRDFLRNLASATIACSLPGLVSCSRRQLPNILFLFADDQRFNTIHALDNKEIQTPTLDRLVSQGTNFTNAYIMGGNSGAVCMPSRAMLLTGRTLAHLQQDGHTIPVEHTMMPELFRQHGYVTFGTGKWHNGRSAYARCFTTGDEIMFGGMSDHWNVPCYHFDSTGKYAARTPVVTRPFFSNKITWKGYDHITDGKHSSELFADAAIRFLNDYQGRHPFFMYVAFTAPHDPRTMPQQYLDMYDPNKISIPPNFLPVHPFDNGELMIRDERLAPHPRTEAIIRRHIADYYAMITHLDAQIDRILKTLQASGKGDNTIIVFSADNGLAVGQHGLMGKQNLYEHSVHVPLIFAGPGVPAGETRDAFCYLPDIFPTLCDFASLPIPKTVDGKSFAKAIADPTYQIRDAVVFGYKHFQRGIRDGDWKLIKYNVHGTQRTQLFHLAKDPWETRNLANDPAQQQRIHQLEAKLQTLLNESGDPVNFSVPDWGIPPV